MKASASILVVGSANMDLVVQVDRFARPGETVLGRGFLATPGGKGANQAVAAARLGARTRFLGVLGTDPFGDSLLRSLQEQGVDTEAVNRVDDQPSGVALITVDDRGENAIVVVPGANHCWRDVDWRRVSDLIQDSDAVVLQLEIPLEVVGRVLALCRQHGTRSILDPAPIPAGGVAALREGDDLLRVDVITPNQVEAFALTGIEVSDRDSAIRAAEVLSAAGCGSVALTMGAEGAVFYTAGQTLIHFRPPEVSVVDTTAAGDAFAAALAVGLAEGTLPVEAVGMACIAGALTTRQLGAQTSLPTRQQVDGTLPPLIEGRE